MRKHSPLLFFLLGMLCFLLAQPLLRIPLLAVLQKNVSFSNFSVANPVLFIFVLSLSAGIFEETMRFIFRKLIWKEEHVSRNNAMVFGFGHGLMEAFLVMAPVIMMAGTSLALPLLERLFAIVAHIGLTLLLFSFVNVKKSMLGWGLAVLLHTLLNFIAAFLLQQTQSVFHTELFIGIFSLGIFTTAYFLSYNHERKQS